MRRISDLWLIIVMAILFGLFFGGLTVLFMRGVSDLLSHHGGDGEKSPVAADTVSDAKVVAFKHRGIAVDLALPSGTLWASRNVGDYFAWGEISTKVYYTADSSMTYKMSYDELRAKGIIDSDGNLTASYDAATAIWGLQWKTPTIQQIKELYDCCTWEWATEKGVDGYEVKGKNGNHIFLPAAGYRTDRNLRQEGFCGYYWSSTATKGNSGGARFLFFRSGDHYRYYNARYAGFSVRPVMR